MMMQTAAGPFYCDILDATSAVNRTYCAGQDIEYREFRGIKRGYYSWHATYNRIAMLNELIFEKYDGWVLFVDADAFVRDFTFSLSEYISTLPVDICFVAAPGANSARWDINAGVFLINLGSDYGKLIVRAWQELLGAHVPDRSLRAVSQPWGKLPSGDVIINDQTLLHWVFMENPALLEMLHIETSLLNYSHGRFIAQIIRRVGLTAEERLHEIRLACAASALNSPTRHWRNLDLIANEANTDKGSKIGNAHSYTRYYSFLFEQFRYRAFNALEIGLLRGGPEAGGIAERNTVAIPSIKMWLEFFPFATLFGIDISDFSKFQNERFRFHQLDLSDHQAAQTIRAKLPPMKFVVDDASHASYHQQVAFVNYFPLVVPGGYYIIEDCDWQPGHMEAELPQTRRTRDIFLDLMNFGVLTFPESILAKSDITGITSEISDIFVHRKEVEASGLGVVKFIAIRKKL